MRFSSGFFENGDSIRDFVISEIEIVERETKTILLEKKVRLLNIFIVNNAGDDTLPEKKLYAGERVRLKSVLFFEQRAKENTNIQKSQNK